MGGALWVEAVAVYERMEIRSNRARQTASGRASRKDGGGPAALKDSRSKQAMEGEGEGAWSG